MFFLLCLVTFAFAGKLRVEILDVGQGDSILIRTPGGKVVLIDAGTGRGYNIVDYLRKRDVESINLMIATHPHADHIGGLDEVLEAFPVKKYMDNGLTHTTQSYAKVMKLVESKDIKYIRPKVGRQLKLDDGARFDVLHPQLKSLSGTRSDLNSNSIVLRLTHGDNCFLFTGDAEEPTEDILVRKGIGQCDILKVAHHGSNHSSSRHFLKAVKPKVALISAGAENRYNHPGDRTIAKLERMGVEIYRTDTMGTILLTSDKSKVKIKKLGKEEQRQNRTSQLDRQNKEENGITESRTQYRTEWKGFLTFVGFSPPLPHFFHFAEGQQASFKNKETTNSNPNTFDLNSASARQLQSIPGIGPARAKAIIAYRNQHGHFQRIADIRRVKGIGPKLSSTISKYVHVKD